MPVANSPGMNAPEAVAPGAAQQVVPAQGYYKVEPEQEVVPFQIPQGHPRVMVGPAELKLIRHRAQTTHKAELESLLAFAERWRNTPLPTPATMPAPATMPGPSTMPLLGRRRRGGGGGGGAGPAAVYRLAFLYLLTGDREHGQLALRTLQSMLQMRVSGRYGLASNFMLGFGCAYDWLHDLMDEETRRTVALKALEWCQAVYDSKEVDPREHFYGHYFNQIPYVLMCGLAIGDEHDAFRAGGFTENALWRLHRTIPGFRYFLVGDSFPMSYPYTVTYLGEVPYLFQCCDVALGTRMFDEHRWIANVIEWWTYAMRDDETFLRFGDYFGSLPVLDNPVYFRVFAAVASRYRHGLAQWWVNRFRVTSNEPDRILFEERESAPEAQDPNGLPRRKFFDRMGVAIARGDFDRGTVAAFKCSPVYLHNHCHRDANSIVIYHKGDQAPDTGAYDGYESPHWYNYYIRTIAHNTIVVYDPQEKIISRGTEYANDGGQRFVNEPHWQPRSYEEIFHEAFRDGRVVSYRQGRGFSYVCGDATHCYNPAKMSRFLRHVVFVEDWPGEKCVSMVVLDEVELARDGLTPRLLLHTSSEPTVDGMRITSQAGEGRLTTTVLLPQTPKIELIGGAGREFWVDGRNYPPRGGEAGLHTLGAWRAEISPDQPSRQVRFLTVLCPADREAPADPPAELTQIPGALIVRQGELSVALVSGDELPPLLPDGRSIVVKLSRPTNTAWW